MPGDKSMLRVVHESGKCGVPKRDTCHFTISSTRLEGLCAPGSSALSLSLWLDQCFFFLAGGAGKGCCGCGSLKMNTKYRGGTKRPSHFMCRRLVVF